ncbi:MAG: ABC transporter substrate-binding protein [Streptosporangiales bacterium]|nr:ABC transporter substrate-binding protein [Streptosporangiales bacterium]
MTGTASGATSPHGHATGATNATNATAATAATGRGRDGATNGLDRRTFLRVAGAGAAATALPPALTGCLMGRNETPAAGGSTVRFAFAPEAIWDYMKQEGILQRFQKERGLNIQAISTWDEFTFFAGGHGELVSTASYELPVLERRTKTKTVTFGKYNLLRITPVCRPESTYQTLADIPKGSKIAVPSAVASTLLWGMFAKKLHNLDFRVGGGDFDLVVEDHFVMAEHLERGEVEAALVIPEAAIGQLREKKLKVMYQGRLPHEIFGPICDCTHLGVMGNMFTATEKWFDAHREDARNFLALWEEGVKLWRAHQAEIIERFPQHFSVEKPEDIEAMQGYLKAHDWFVDSVYLDADWIEREKRIYELMKETGFMDKNAPIPRFEALTPAGGG